MLYIYLRKSWALFFDFKSSSGLIWFFRNVLTWLILEFIKSKEFWLLSFISWKLLWGRPLELLLSFLLELKGWNGIIVLSWDLKKEGLCFSFSAWRFADSFDFLLLSSLWLEFKERLKSLFSTWVFADSFDFFSLSIGGFTKSLEITFLSFCLWLEFKEKDSFHEYNKLI